MAVVYCTAQEVIDFMGIIDRSTGNTLTISSTTDPKQSFVEELINWAENEIEERVGHAWTTRTSTNEIHDISNIYEPYWGTPIHLQHRKITTINAEQYQDITSTSDWKMQYDLGVLYLRNYYYSLGRENRVRITYRYGDSSVPKWVKEVVIKLVAIKLIERSFAMSYVKFGEDRGLRTSEVVQQWNDSIDRAISDHQEFVVVEY